MSFTSYLRQTLRYARLISEATILVRMDSGNDSLGNIKLCWQEKAPLYHQAQPALGDLGGVAGDSQGVWRTAGALSQAQARADIIDVNISTFGVDEANLLPQAVQAVGEASIE